MGSVSHSVAGPGSGAFLTPGSGKEKNPDPGSGLTSEIIFPRAWKQFLG